MNHGIFGNAWLGATEPPADCAKLATGMRECFSALMEERQPTVDCDSYTAQLKASCPAEEAAIKAEYGFGPSAVPTAPSGPSAPPSITERPPTTKLGRDGLPVQSSPKCVFPYIEQPNGSCEMCVGCSAPGSKCNDSTGYHWCESSQKCEPPGQACPSAPVPPASEIPPIDQKTKWLVLGGVAVVSFGIAALLIKKA